jgi:hypothetical protein
MTKKIRTEIDDYFLRSAEDISELLGRRNWRQAEENDDESGGELIEIEGIPNEE